MRDINMHSKQHTIDSEQMHQTTMETKSPEVVITWQMAVTDASQREMRIINNSVKTKEKIIQIKQKKKANNK